MVAKVDSSRCGGCETYMDECPTEAITTTINLRGLASGLLILPLDELDAEKTAALTEVLSTYD